MGESNVLKVWKVYAKLKHAAMRKNKQCQNVPLEWVIELNFDSRVKLLPKSIVQDNSEA